MGSMFCLFEPVLRLTALSQVFLWFTPFMSHSSQQSAFHYSLFYQCEHTNTVNWHHAIFIVGYTPGFYSGGNRIESRPRRRLASRFHGCTQPPSVHLTLYNLSYWKLHQMSHIQINNFCLPRLSLGRYSSLTDSGHGVQIFCLPSLQYSVQQNIKGANEYWIFVILSINVTGC
jgi:hypothetical protein